MTSRAVSADSASTTFGSHAGKIGVNAAAAAVAAAVPATNWRRDSALYSWQPQSSWSMSLIDSSIPLECARAQRERERLSHPCCSDGCCGEVRDDALLQLGGHLPGECPLADCIRNTGRRVDLHQRSYIHHNVPGRLRGEECAEVPALQDAARPPIDIVRIPVRVL